MKQIAKILVIAIWFYQQNLATAHAQNVDSVDSCVSKVGAVQDRVTTLNLQSEKFVEMAQLLSSVERHCAAGDFGAANDLLRVIEKKSKPMRADVNKAMTKRSVQTWPVGKYEIVCLTSHRLGYLSATFDDYFNQSFLSVGDWHIYERKGEQRVSFSFNCADRSATHTSSIEIVREHVWEDGISELLVGIEGRIEIDFLSLPNLLYITKRRIRSTPVVFGNDFIQRGFAVHNDEAFLMSSPTIPDQVYY